MAGDLFRFGPLVATSTQRVCNGEEGEEGEAPARGDLRVQDLG